MTPRQAAAIIGCSPQQVRTLIRTGVIKATKRFTPGNTTPGYCYSVSRREAERYRDKPQTKGWPRGQLYELVEE